MAQITRHTCIFVTSNMNAANPIAVFHLYTKVFAKVIIVSLSIVFQACIVGVMGDEDVITID